MTDGTVEIWPDNYPIPFSEDGYRVARAILVEKGYSTDRDGFSVVTTANRILNIMQYDTTQKPILGET